MPPKRNTQIDSTVEEGGLEQTNQPNVPVIVSQFEALADVSRYESMMELSPNAMRILFDEFTQDVVEQVRLQNTDVITGEDYFSGDDIFFEFGQTPQHPN